VHGERPARLDPSQLALAFCPWPNATLPGAPASSPRIHPATPLAQAANFDSTVGSGWSMSAMVAVLLCWSLASSAMCGLLAWRLLCSASAARSLHAAVHDGLIAEDLISWQELQPGSHMQRQNACIGLEPPRPGMPVAQSFELPPSAPAVLGPLEKQPIPTRYNTSGFCEKASAVRRAVAHSSSFASCR
jgi:hypothetical protein